MIKNIIFDLGNVMIDFSPREYVESKIAQEKVEEIYKCVFQSEEWPMLDRGTINEENARRNIISRNIENEDLINAVFESWYDILIPIENSVNILKRLKEKGLKVYYLSNFHCAAFEYMDKKYDLFKLFDGGVFSFKEKLLKPEREIYDKIMKEYDLIPSETVFIDDTKVNVEAARKLGLEGIVLDDPKNLLAELQRFDIDV